MFYKAGSILWASYANKIHNLKPCSLLSYFNNTYSKQQLETCLTSKPYIVAPVSGKSNLSFFRISVMYNLMSPVSPGLGCERKVVYNLEKRREEKRRGEERRGEEKRGKERRGEEANHTQHGNMTHTCTNSRWYWWKGFRWPTGILYSVNSSLLGWSAMDKRISAVQEKHD